ncbi:MAG: LysM peptidoglycan-binding domain-containing protein, partial [Chloroflexales bacterium]|nr:LysM peptidoglycan-binding domain-containing protein [Chloroflexales bacterium]
LAPAADALLARLLAAPAAPRVEQALLTRLLASEPPPTGAAAAPPPAVSFATVVQLPAAAYAYSAATVQLPMIALADNIPPTPPPPPVPIVAAAEQPPAPPDYVQPPGYQDGVPFGGQIGAVPRPAASAARPATARPAAARPATTRPTIYVVRAGDTLSGIALRFYGNAGYAPAIWEANYRLIGANPNLIFPGDRLALPGIAGPTVTVVSAPLPARGPISQRAYYTIQPQDFLRWMAQRAYGTEIFWPEIYNANLNVLGPNPDLIYPGVTVYIP